MAFVLNVLHRDFSLLCTDTRCQQDSPRRMALRRRASADSEDVHVVDRIETLCLNADASLAIGLTGSREQHGYTAAIEASATIDDALTTVREYMDDFRADRGTLLRGGPWPEYGGVLTFHDPLRGSYYASWYTFSVAHNYSRVMVPPNTGARLLHAGSGGAAFEQLCATRNIHALAASVLSAADLKPVLAWVRETYILVAGNDPTSGQCPIGVLSTRADPVFRAIEL